MHSLSCLTLISNCVIFRNSVLFPSNIYSALVFFTYVGLELASKRRLKCCFEHINARPVCAPPPMDCAISNRKGAHCLPPKRWAPSPIKHFVRLLPPKRDAPSLTEEGCVDLQPKRGAPSPTKDGVRLFPPKKDTPFTHTKEGCPISRQRGMRHLPPNLW